MAVGTIGAVLDTVEYETNDVVSCDIIKIADGIIAVAWIETTADDAHIATYPVAANGTWGAQIDLLQVDANSLNYIFITRYPGTDIYILTFQDNASGNIKLATVDIDSAGNIAGAVIDTHTLTRGNSLRDNGGLIHISGDVFAIAFPDNTDGNKGYLLTLDINNDGTIDAVPEIDSWTYTANAGMSAAILHRSGTKYIMLIDDNSTVNATTLDIADNGTITKAWIDTLVILGVGYLQTKPNLLQVKDDIHIAVGSLSSDSDGWAYTFDVDTNGNIGAAVIDTVEFDNVRGNGISAAIINESSVAIFYRDNDSDGWIKTYPVSVAGNIGAMADSLEFEPTYCKWTNICEPRTDLYVVSTMGDPTGNFDDGWLYSMEISSSAAFPTSSISALCVLTGMI